MRSVRQLIEGEQGQDSFEYLLIVGVVVAPLLVALIVGVELLIPEVVGYICPSVDTAANPIATVGSCVTNIVGG